MLSFKVQIFLKLFSLKILFIYYLSMNSGGRDREREAGSPLNGESHPGLDPPPLNYDLSGRQICKLLRHPQSSDFYLTKTLMLDIHVPKLFYFIFI